MSNVIKKIRQLESLITYKLSGQVCPNCYFSMADSEIANGWYVCPCCEFWSNESVEKEISQQ